MITFDIQPFVGALPIEFGMPRGEVIRLLGSPDSSAADYDDWGPMLAINVGYDGLDLVDHIGLGGRGDHELSFLGRPLRSGARRVDPNPTFLALDPEPLERVGFLYFTRLGVATAGYHDDDESQQSISVYPKGVKDRLLQQAGKAAVEKYHLGSQLAGT